MAIVLRPQICDVISPYVQVSNDRAVTRAQTKLKPNMAKMFAMMHQSVNEFSKRMLAEMRRHNYVTPTNYLELVDGFKQLRSAQ